MPPLAKVKGASLADQLPDGSLAQRAIQGLKSAADWLGISDDASVETSMMGSLGPAGVVAPAITLVTKKPLTALLRKMAPRNAQGQMLDPQSYPNITAGVQEIVERFPRVASHLRGIRTGLTGARGEHIVPSHITERARRYGPEGLKGQDVGLIGINENLIEPSGAYETLAHEFGHAAQFLADPRNFNHRYGLYNRHLGYEMNPYEMSARFTGKNQGARRLGQAAPAGMPDAASRGAMTNDLRRLESLSEDNAMLWPLVRDRPGDAPTEALWRDMQTERALAELKAMTGLMRIKRTGSY